MDLQQMGYMYPTCSCPHWAIWILLHPKLSSFKPQFIMSHDSVSWLGISSAGLIWAHCVAAQSWGHNWAGRSMMLHAHAWQLVLAVSRGNWFSSTWSFIFQSPPLSTWPLGRTARTYLVLACKRAKIREAPRARSQGLGPKVGHVLFGCIHWSNQVVGQTRFEGREIKSTS